MLKIVIHIVLAILATRGAIAADTSLLSQKEIIQLQCPTNVYEGERIVITLHAESEKGLDSIWWNWQDGQNSDFEKAHFNDMNGEKTFAKKFHDITLKRPGTYKIEANSRDLKYGQNSITASQASEGNGIASCYIEVKDQLEPIVQPLKEIDKKNWNDEPYGDIFDKSAPFAELRCPLVVQTNGKFSIELSASASAGLQAAWWMGSSIWNGVNDKKDLNGEKVYDFKLSVILPRSGIHKLDVGAISQSNLSIASCEINAKKSLLKLEPDSQNVDQLKMLTSLDPIESLSKIETLNYGIANEKKGIKGCQLLKNPIKVEDYVYFSPALRYQMKLYRELWRDFCSKSETNSIVTLYMQGQTLVKLISKLERDLSYSCHRKVVVPQNRANGCIESSRLDGIIYERLPQILPGINAANIEIVYFLLDEKDFREISKFGSDEDKAFFASSVLELWKPWRNQVTSYSACTDYQFGWDKELKNIIRLRSLLKNDIFRLDLQEYENQMWDELITDYSICTCGTKDSLIKTIESLINNQVLKEFPIQKEKTIKMLQDIKQQKIEIRENCRPA
jgi:hypothetical protein